MTSRKQRGKTCTYHEPRAHIVDFALDETGADFKRATGCSELEVRQKRTALKNVMAPDAVDMYFARLDHAGFDWISVWIRYLKWVSPISVA